MENYFNYPLTLQCVMFDDIVELVFVYNPAHLSETQILGLSHQLEHVSQQLASAELTNLGELSIASKWDEEQALVYNEASGAPELVASCAHKLIEDQVRRQPHAPAISGWDASFTYRELDSIANRLSHHLTKSLGVKRGNLIPVCFENPLGLS